MHARLHGLLVTLVARVHLVPWGEWGSMWVCKCVGMWVYVDGYMGGWMSGWVNGWVFEWVSG